MPSRNETARAHARLQLETPISDDANLLKLQEQVADYVREAKRRDPTEPNELISTVIDASRVTTFGTPSENIGAPRHLGSAREIAEGSRFDGTIQIASHTKEEDRFGRLAKLPMRCPHEMPVAALRGQRADPSGDCPILTPAVRALVVRFVAAKSQCRTHLQL